MKAKVFITKCKHCTTKIKQKPLGSMKTRCDPCDSIYKTAYLAGYMKAERTWKNKLIQMMGEKLCWCKSHAPAAEVEDE